MMPTGASSVNVVASYRGRHGIRAAGLGRVAGRPGPRPLNLAKLRPAQVAGRQRPTHFNRNGLLKVTVILCVGLSSARYHAPSRQGIGDTVVQATYLAELIPLFADFEISAGEKMRWKFLNCEAYGVRRS